MTSRENLGWRVSQSVWDQFENYVFQKWGSQGSYVRIELEQAMREYLDKDATLANAEDLLRQYTQLQEFSSSSAEAGIAAQPYADRDTTKLGHRVNATLKDEFGAFATKHHDENVGFILTRALKAYLDGGRSQRILELVKALIRNESGSEADSINGDTTMKSDENPDSEHYQETDNLSSNSESGINSDSNLRQQKLHRDTTDLSNESSDESDYEVPTQFILGASEWTKSVQDDISMIPRSTMKKAVAVQLNNSALELDKFPVADSTFFDEAIGAVAGQLSLVEHPFENKDVFVSENIRESIDYWDDLDRPERTVLLRRYAAAEALDNRFYCAELNYTDVMEVFEKHTDGAPSHDYAYTLMELAADEDGYVYGSRDRQTLKVNLEDVRPEIIEWVDDEFAGIDVPDSVLRDLEIPCSNQHSSIAVDDD